MYRKEGNSIMGNIKVYDVADYIVKNMPGITAMKLQKLVYYCQSWSLAWDDEPLFDEDFQAWANGPVCPELYFIHRGQFIIEENLFEEFKSEENKLTESNIETIKAILKHYGNKSPHFLSELTHKEQPWKETRKDTPLGEPSQNVISKEAMQQYYGGLIG